MRHCLMTGQAYSFEACIDGVQGADLRHDWTI